jgi:carboxyl-terminal processing protease
VSKIRGPSGSEVQLLVLHLGAIDPVTVSVKRGVIPLESVLLRSEPGARIAHIRLTNFYADTAEILSDTIQQAVDDGAEGIVLDVRDNPGGLLRSVVDIVNLFLDEDDLRAQFGDADVPTEMKDPPVILFERDGEGRQNNWRVGDDAPFPDLPIVLLANANSASASEILVGALQDYGRAAFVGDTTFGKGSVNILRQLNNGGGLFLTFAHWYTPSGRLIQNQGLEPDVEVVSRDARTAEVNQLESAVEVLESQLGTGTQGN